MKKNRRRAIHAELVRESKDNEGYFRYNITIKEVDGTEHIVPAYGKDMQDAIERLIWIERIEKITSKKGIMPLFAISLLIIVALSGMFATIKNNPLYIVGGLGLSIVFILISSFITNYLNKK